MWDVRALPGPLEHNVSILPSRKYKWVYVVMGRGEGVVSDSVGLCVATEQRFFAHSM